MSATRAATRTQLVALAILGVLVAGLAYVRFAPASAPVAVPAGAEAGDLTMHTCAYRTEAGEMAADCGTLVVPENRADPESRLIALPLTRIHARSDDATEPIFALWGGPGITNTAWPHASRFAESHDVVLVGYRGVDGSVRLDCPEVESALSHSRDFLGEESFRALGDAYRSCADRLTNEGVDLAGYGIVQIVDDIEAARAALGYGRINLLSESAGTRTAMTYAWRYPDSIHRSVMVAVNPPGHFPWDARTTDEQLGRYAALCAADASCGDRTNDLVATIRQASAEIPERWLFLPIKAGNVSIISFFGLMESSAAAGPVSGPTVVDMWLSAAEGDPSGLWFASTFADIVLPRAFVWGQYAAFGRADAQAVSNYFASGDRDFASNFGRAASASSWGGGALVDAWPPVTDEADYTQVPTSEVQTLLIGGELDFSTPPQIATEELLPYLPNGQEVVLPGFGHTTSLWTEQREAGSRLINTFFDSGRVDTSLYEPQRVNLAPDGTLTGLANVIAGVMVGGALIAALSLLAMAHRVQSRGRIGRTPGAFVRSVYPLVLGLGGWFLGSLAVLATMPGVPLDDELLVVVSVGVPIGLGVALAWVHRDWSPATKATGLAAASGTAMVGAWLGFQATDGVFALVTAIVGAAVGGNLALIFLDIARAGSPTVVIRSAPDTEPSVSVVTSGSRAKGRAIDRDGVWTTRR